MKEAITISIDPEVRKKATIILERNGQKMSSVLELHLKEIIKQDGK